MLYNRGEHVWHCSPFGPLMLVASAGRFILLALADASIESLALLLSPLAGAPGADIGLIAVVYRYEKLITAKVAFLFHSYLHSVKVMTVPGGIYK